MAILLHGIIWVYEPEGIDITMSIAIGVIMTGRRVWSLALKSSYPAASLVAHSDNFPWSVSNFTDNKSILISAGLS